MNMEYYNVTVGLIFMVSGTIWTIYGFLFATYFIFFGGGLVGAEFWRHVDSDRNQIRRKNDL